LLRARVMPCLLLKDWALVKTVRFKETSYIGDPVNAIRIYNEKEVDELILLDIMATREGRPPLFELLRDVASECFMPLCYGGGVRSLEDLKRLFGIGIEKVSVNSFAEESPGFIREASAAFGSQSIVVSIDVQKTFLGRYAVCSRGGQKMTKADPVDFARKMEAAGAGELLVTSIDRDGTWEGYDLDLLKRITSAVTIPVIACGGAGRVSHFGEAVARGGASAVAAGSMVVYQKKGMGVLINFPTREELEKELN
jgi:imidazole glycerol-phosphate synthase subunit HisF